MAVVVVTTNSPGCCVLCGETLVVAHSRVCRECVWGKGFEAPHDHPLAVLLRGRLFPLQPVVVQVRPGLPWR